MVNSRPLPGWMYSVDDTDALPSQPTPPQDATQCALAHLLPRLREYLRIVDPGRVDKGMELLVNCQSEEELFSDLQAQYGDVEAVEQIDRPNTAAIPTKSRPATKKFIVSDSEGESIGSDEDHEDDEEEEFSDDESVASGIQEPDPDDTRPRKRVRASPPPQPVGVPVQNPTGPTVVCQYGRRCYRKNPAHFAEFAHPWRIDPH